MTLEHPLFEAKCTPHGVIGWFPKAEYAVKWLEAHRSISDGCKELKVTPLSSSPFSEKDQTLFRQDAEQ